MRLDRPRSAPLVYHKHGIVLGKDFIDEAAIADLPHLMVISVFVEVAGATSADPSLG